MTINLGRLRRKKNRSRIRRSLKLSQPPPPPPPEHWDEKGFLIAVQVAINSDAAFLRFKLPETTVNELIEKVKSEFSPRKPINYVAHRHDVDKDPKLFLEYSLDPKINGPFPLNLRSFCVSSAVGTVVYCLSNDCTYPYIDYHELQEEKEACHSFLYCDFGRKELQWKVTKPLLRHRFSVILSMARGKIYVFEEEYTFEKDASRRTPFGLCFDPLSQSCWELPVSPFQETYSCEHIVALLGQQFLVCEKRGRTQCLYNLDTFTWSDCSLDGLLEHVSRMGGTPVTVEEHNTVYWLDKCDVVRAFDWSKGMMLQGPIIGLDHECMPVEVCRSCMSLIHLKDKLFCIIWSGPYRTLHLTVVHVCVDQDYVPVTNFPYRLSAFVVACFCYHLEFDVFIKTAHLL